MNCARPNMALQRTRRPSPSLGPLASLTRLAAERPTVSGFPVRAVFRESLRLLALGVLATLFLFGAFDHEKFVAWYFYGSLSLSALFFALAVGRLVVILKRHGRENLI